jgi:hypothetical protein
MNGFTTLKKNFFLTFQSLVGDIIRVRVLLVVSKVFILIIFNLIKTGHDLLTRVTYQIPWQPLYVQLPDRLTLGR